jgi:hypothetical protein
MTSIHDPNFRLFSPLGAGANLGLIMNNELRIVNFYIIVFYRNLFPNVKLLSNVTKLLPKSFFNVKYLLILIKKYETLITQDMKKCIILVAILFSGIIFAQKAEPVLEPFGKKVKATYFFENGQVQQEGFFENGKLEGVWVSFDEKGNKTSSGEYNNGKKTGKWFFWSEKSDNGFSNLSEVDYSNNRIASVKNWKQEVIVSID